MTVPMKLLPIACVVIAAVFAATTTAEADRTDVLTDEAGDVGSVLDPGRSVEGQQAIDIVRAAVLEEGDDVTVTLELAGEHDPDASYSVEVIAEGDASAKYTFSYILGQWSIDGCEPPVERPVTSVSDDGSILSWTLERTRVDASSGLNVIRADSMATGLATYFDEVAADPPGDGDDGTGGGPEDGRDTGSDDDGSAVPGSGALLSGLALVAALATVVVARKAR